MKELYAKYAHPNYGYDDDQKDCRDAGLVLNKGYKVKDVNMSKSSTRIQLAGVKGAFNSVNFDFYMVEKVDITSMPEYNPYLQW